MSVHVLLIPISTVADFRDQCCFLEAYHLKGCVSPWHLPLIQKEGFIATSRLYQNNVETVKGIKTDIVIISVPFQILFFIIWVWMIWYWYHTHYIMGMYLVSIVKYWVNYEGIYEGNNSPMMTSSNENMFRDTAYLCGKIIGHRWIPRKKASDAALWCFFFFCTWIKGWVNNGEAGDLRRPRAHYDVV